MSFEKLPFQYNFEECNPRYRLLFKVNRMFECYDITSGPPVLLFITLMKESFCSMCTITGVNQNHGDTSSVDNVISDLMKMSTPPEDRYVVGYHKVSQETFLAILLPKDITNIPEGNEDYALLFWRKARIFTAEDVITAQACMMLFFSRLRELIMRKGSTNEDFMAAIKMRSEVLLRASIPLNPIPTRNLAQLYSEALDMVCKSVIITDKNGTIIHMNTVASKLFQRNLSEDARRLGGIDWVAALLHPDDLQYLVKTWNESIASFTGFTINFRLLMPSKDTYHMFECLARPFGSDVNDKGGYWIFCIFDIEDSRIMEETRIGAIRKTKFLAEMSHEIRTPLACVIGTCSLLRYTALTKEQSDLLNTIRVCSQQLFTLTNNILDLSKIEESKLILESRPIHLERVLAEVIDIFVPDLVRKHLDITLSIGYPDVPELIMTDEGRLRQIVTNLLSNAIKFTRDDSTISVTVQKVLEDMVVSLPRAPNPNVMLLMIAVEDEGPGIPSSVPQSQLFDTFVQLDSSTYRKYGGSGLGLTISKKLVNLLGGDIWYQSEVGKMIEPTPLDMIEMTPVEDVVSFRIVAAIREFTMTLNSKHRILILIATKKEKLALYTSKLLAKLPHLTVLNYFGTSVSLQDLMRSKSPDILITDLIEQESMLKNMIETEFVGENRAIILIDDKDEVNWIESKTLRFIKKPIKPAVLLKTIHEVLLTILSTCKLSEKERSRDDVTMSPPTQSIWLQHQKPQSEASVATTILKSKSFVQQELVQSNNAPIAASIPSLAESHTFANKYPQTILLAEDNLLNQQLMTRILKKYGYDQVYIAGNGKQAVDLFIRLWEYSKLGKNEDAASTRTLTSGSSNVSNGKSVKITFPDGQTVAAEPINTIFMDMQMPELEGPEATEYIRQYCQSHNALQPHVMALTANAFSEDRDICIKAGMCSYLSKPLKWSTLEEELEKAWMAVNDQIKCRCNEERFKAAAETSLRQVAFTSDSASDFGHSGEPQTVIPFGEHEKLPVAKPTGLDI